MGSLSVNDADINTYYFYFSLSISQEKLNALEIQTRCAASSPRFTLPTKTLKCFIPFYGASLVVQLVKNPPTMQEIRVRSLGCSCLENPMDCRLPGSSVRGIARVEHDLATTPPPPSRFMYHVPSWFLDTAHSLSNPIHSLPSREGRTHKIFLTPTPRVPLPSPAGL